LKKTPIVSIVIPTYNRAWTLSQAIDSVLNQAYCNRELIVVDDGSTDHTKALLATYGEKIKIILQENRGVSAARNRGIEMASGEYIALLDSDDIWLPEKIESQIQFFKENPHALICQTQEIWIRNGRRVNPKRRHQKKSGMIFESSLS
jgi:glycosyltransferase involved in cell wall biosynthesis